ncbi:MAG: type 4a pilus biogenesis protein PilO [Planctomycetota bacterium]
MTENQRLLLIAGITVVLSGAAGGGVYWAKSEAEAVREQMAQTEQQIAVSEAKIKRIPDLERQVIILRENLKEYVKILPEKQELGPFLRAVNQFAGQSGIDMQRFTPGRVAGRKDAEFEEWTYTFEFNATLWQFLKFANFFENYERFVKVKNFQLTSGGGEARADGEYEEGDVQHKVNMMVETYVYTGNAKGTDANIPNYAAKQQALAEDILRNLTDIRIDRYEFRDARGRRDIFVDPREFSYGARDGGGVPLQQQKKILDDFADEVSRLETLQKRTREDGITIFERYNLERELKAGLESLKEKIEKIDAQRAISYQPFKYQWVKRIGQPIEMLERNLVSDGRPQDDRFLPRKEVEGLLAAMSTDLETGELQAARDRFDAVQDRLHVPPEDDRAPMVDKLRDLYLRAGVALEFGTQRLDISGVVVNDEGRSGLILNGAVYQEGDYVNDELLVKAVGREHIEFVYKGFTLVKTR